MQLTPTSVSSSKQRGCGKKTGTRLQTKRKRLDAICEEEYNRNHREGNKGDDVEGPESVDLELRRSSRVRRAPVILDVSPRPPKKRQKVGKSGRSGRGKRRLGSVKEEEEERMREVLTLGSWTSRLRTRRRNASVKVKMEDRVLSSSRKLFEDVGGNEEDEEEGEEDENDDDDEEEDEMEEEGQMSDREMVVVKSKRLGRVKAASGSGSEVKVDICCEEEEREVEKGGIRGDGVVEGVSAFESEMSENNEDEVVEGTAVVENEISQRNEERLDGNLVEVINKEHREVSNCMKLDEGYIDQENAKVIELIESMEPAEEQVQQFKCQDEGANGEDVIEVHNVAEEVEDCCVHDAKDNGLFKVPKKTLEHKSDMKVEESNQTAAETISKPRIKQGRRCGLCGGATDGKPPKKLVHDAGDSENEAYSSSASEEPNYDIWDGFGDEPGWLGRLLGPTNDRYGIARIWVHQQCAVWSPEVYFAGLGHLKMLGQHFVEEEH
ncbi:hypothetical protein ERO13_A08G021408v2 [Gossypium hirsutum]|nr:hypothetical protein ERO13_A08G021408v2 [Gossypium hirsutum]